MMAARTIILRGEPALSVRHVDRRTAGRIARRAHEPEFHRHPMHLTLGEAFEHRHILAAIVGHEAPPTVRLAYADRLVDRDSLADLAAIVAKSLDMKISILPGLTVGLRGKQPVPEEEFLRLLDPSPSV